MEELFFIDTGADDNSRKIFVHALFNENKEGVFVLLFNPFLDRIASFSARSTQVEIARTLNSQKVNTIHFDYYGTGDSGGESYEVDLEKTIDDVKGIIRFIKESCSPTKIILFGVRFGADLALLISQAQTELDSLILYEPIVNGKYFYKEKKYIVKSNHLLWNINPETEIKINGKIYEDFDGIPFSDDLKEFLCNMRSDELEITGKNILLFNLDTSKEGEKVDSISNKKHIENFIIKHKQKNRIKEIKLDVSEGPTKMTRQTILMIVKFVQLIGSVAAVENKL